MQARRRRADRGKAHQKAVKIKRHTISVLVDNEAGVLARVVGLFSGRGYNIESLTVAEVDPPREPVAHHHRHLRHADVIEQIKNQLRRLVPVHKVSDLTTGRPAFERELALVKVAGRRRASGSRRCASPTSSAPAPWTPPTKSFVFEIDRRRPTRSTPSSS